jgi:hypothetical protein
MYEKYKVGDEYQTAGGHRAVIVKKLPYDLYLAKHGNITIMHNAEGEPEGFMQERAKTYKLTVPWERKEKNIKPNKTH